MDDFIKLKIDEPNESILSNSGLNFTEPINIDTGEIHLGRYGYTKRTAQFKGLVFELVHNKNTDKKYLEIFGSLHKFYHSGQNCNDYYLNELTATIKEICELVIVHPDQIKVHRLEFGVNIMVKHKTNNVINSFICYMGKPYELRQYEGRGYLKKFSLSQYELKVYNKGLQYNLNHNLLRYEIKVNRMDYLLKKGIEIECITDLLKPNVLLQLRQQIELTLDNFLFMDYRINLNEIKNKRERLILTEGSNPNFWNKYRETHSPKGYQKKVKVFKLLVLKYAPSNLQNEIKELVLAKWDCLNSTPILPNVETKKVPQYYTHIVGNNIVPEKRYCLTCGRDISTQKKGSVFCSEKRLGREVKKCRNKVSNRKQFEKRFYTGYTLF
jgi:hypothetical protein